MIIRMLSWLIASLPILAAGYWASFSARMPEALADRIALGEVTPRWDFASWTETTGEPMHAMARALHLSVLHVPGATIASVVWVNVFLAFMIVVTLCGLCRRAFPATASMGPLMFGTFGLFVASPAFGGDWLYGQRVGLFVVPVLFVTALKWLQGEGRFAGRAMLAIMVAGFAPWFHIHGVIVATALIPALFGAARSAQSHRRVAWIGALLLIGDVAAFFSMRTAPSLSVAGADWLGSLASMPGDTAMLLLSATGDAWLDLLPSTKIDEQLLGGMSWLLPLALLPIGNRSPEACRVASTWWSCVLFGLLLVVVNAVRYELQPPIGPLREVMFGSFLLPIGVIGLMTSRFSSKLLPMAAGVMIALLLQDWHKGVEDLRRAHMRAQQLEASRVVPPAATSGSRVLPVTSADELSRLQGLGWVPGAQVLPNEDVVAQFAVQHGDERSGITGGDSRLVRGTARSSLRLSTPHWVAIVAKSGDSAPRIVGDVMPNLGNGGRSVAWQVQFAEALPEGSRVRAVGLMMPGQASSKDLHGTAVALGPAFIVQGNKLVADNDS